MRSKKSIIILCSVIAVLALGIFAVSRIEVSKDEKVSELAQEKNQENVIFKANRDSIESIRITAKDNSMEFKNIDNKWSLNELDSQDTDEKKILNTVDYAAHLVSDNKVEENPSDTVQYGFNDPTAVIDIKTDRTNNIVIGSKSASTGKYFIMNTDDKTVYMIPANTVESIIQPQSYYTDFDRFDVVTDDITEINIHRPSGNISLRLKSDLKNNNASVWEMTAPYESNVIDEYVDDKLLEPLGNLCINKLSSDGSEFKGVNTVELKIKPYDEVTKKYSQEYTELIETETLSGDSVRVRYKDKIFDVSKNELDFINEKVFNILSKLQNFVDVKDIKSVAVTAGDREDIIEVTQKDNDFSFKLNGKDINSSEGKKVYQTIIGIEINDIYNNEPLGESVLELNFKGKGAGNDNVFEFKEIDEMNCALVKNNKAEFTVKKSEVEEFIKGIREFADSNK